MDLWLRPDAAGTHGLVVDGRAADGSGIAMERTNAGAVELILSDGVAESRWECDPGLLETGRAHHVGVIVDPGPRLKLFVVDGKLNDGGEHRQFGWGKLNADMDMAAARTASVRIPTTSGIERLRLYDRALAVSDLIAAYRAGSC